ncbi:MAG: DUF447 family protein [Nitrospinota bacterium]|nr:DUF447 family protein [Nitrospinota bacterium]
MIIESIVSTVSKDGTVNFAPMGARMLEGNRLAIIVFHSTHTCQNLSDNKACVINLLYNPKLFVLTTLTDHVPPHKLSESSKGGIMDEADEALEFAVDRVEEMEGKSRFEGHITSRIRIKEPSAGYCRAGAAVIEALIAITRKGVLPDAEIEEMINRGHAIVSKTGSETDMEAMRIIEDHWTKSG